MSLVWLSLEFQNKMSELRNLKNILRWNNKCYQIEIADYRDQYPKKPVIKYLKKWITLYN